MLTEEQRRSWHPVASSGDLVPRHVFAGEIWGQELALWRADDGHVNAWENRCLHRGVRLTTGVNLGSELMCQYHGWRYANRTAGCTYIPAHPADAPARTICNRVYPALERHGLVWVALEGTIEAAVLPELPENGLALRPIPIDVPPAEVEAVLDQAFRGEPVRWLVQPVDAARSIIRGILAEAPAEPLPVLRRWSARLSRLRERLEALPRPPVQPIPAELHRVDPALAGLPEPGPTGTSLRVRVARKWPVAADVLAFRLTPLEGELPAFQPGAHIDVQLPSGLMRQYSLTNGPDDTTGWVIGVKREPSGLGGSACLHDVVREGDVLAVSPPRNNFPLRRDGLLTLFVAGGIGLTPLLAMARTLHLAGLPYRFHAFARSAAHLPFAAELGGLGPSVERHLGLGPEATLAALDAIIGPQGEKHELYLCGPTPFLEAARAIAAAKGWPDAAVHFEYFKNERPRDMSTAFEVALARSALTVEVQPGQSIVDAVAAHGIHIPTSCAQGACGTCRVGVIEGTIDHQDVHLTGSERAKGDCLMACVSRAAGGRLVLDL